MSNTPHTIYYGTILSQVVREYASVLSRHQSKSLPITNSLQLITPQVTRKIVHPMSNNVQHPPESFRAKVSTPDCF